MSENYQQSQKKLPSFLQDKYLLAWLIIVLLTIIVCGLIIYIYIFNNRIKIEKATINGEVINLSATMSGTLNEVFVNIGDQVLADTIVAKVGNELIKTKVDGEIIDVKKNIGTLYSSGQPVVSLVSNGSLKVVGSLAEDKGLADVRVGQIAMFTVDAFGGKKYYGVVDEISPTAKESGVVFNISDKRETKEFNIKIRFNNTLYNELKNGMSAKIWIYKK